jgi:hypothetical protein
MRGDPTVLALGDYFDALSDEEEGGHRQDRRPCAGRTTINENERARSETGPSDFQVRCLSNYQLERNQWSHVPLGLRSAFISCRLETLVSRLSFDRS